MFCLLGHSRNINYLEGKMNAKGLKINKNCCMEQYLRI